MTKNYLINIAIDKYRNAAFPPLNNAVNDAKKLEKVLLEKYGFELVNDSLYNDKATRKGIIELLNSTIAETTSDDNLIIHYAGHGLIHPKSKKGFWIPQDAQNEISDFIPNSTIIDIIEEIDAKHIFLILDSCFSGSFLTQSRSSVDFHYSKIDESQSRWVLSSGRNEKVSDGQPGKGSPFSVILNEFLEQNNSRTFSVSELATAVSKGTGSVSKQQPIFAHIEGVGHKDGQMVFNLTKKQLKAFTNTIETNLSQLVISLDLAKEIQKIGITKKSIFAYFQKGESTTVQVYDTEVDFICYAYTFEEIVQFIPEHIEVDENTYIARSDGYDQLGEPEEGQYDFATVTFQRTEVLETPYMSICMCRGRMVAFSKTKDGYFNNLICWGKNQAETAALMILELKKENKIQIKNGR